MAQCTLQSVVCLEWCSLTCFNVGYTYTVCKNQSIQSNPIYVIAYVNHKAGLETTVHLGLPHTKTLKHSIHAGMQADYRGSNLGYTE